MTSSEFHKGWFANFFWSLWLSVSREAWERGMPVADWRARFARLFFAAVLCASFAPGHLFADSDGKAKPSEKRGTDKPETAASGLTERERWLLDRVEQLEKRVAELEARGDPVAAGQPRITPMTAAGGTILSNANGAPGTESATMGTNGIPANAPVASVAVQPSGQGGETQPAKAEPFAFADFTWLNGNARTKESPMETKFFTPEVRADVAYNYSFNHPKDDTIGGSSEVFRHGEVQVTQLGVGGDFHYDHVRARLMTQFGMYSQTTPRNDASPARGQWNLDNAYRYLSEAYGGYHFDVLHGINVDAGIFMSYVGLFSYYQFDNWAYQPSYVSSNTPWFFNGVRVQIFPTAHLKIEPWFINGWQAYFSANHRPGLGGQIKWTPRPWINIISNNYGLGRDDLFIPNRRRIHTDDSIEVKYFDRPDSTLDKMAFSLTADAGCEYGGGVSCYGNKAGGPKQSFLGFMLYNRFWFHRDLFGLTVGGGKINNPGRYLVLLPPINGETAVTASTNSPYFTENPGDPFKAWDSSLTFDYMPKQYITFRWEYDYRHANVPYWTGRGGITPPSGNTGFPTQFVCQSGVTSGATSLPDAQTACSAIGSTVWFPDLRRNESFIDMSIMVKF